MIELVCTPLPVRIALRVAMVTMQLRIAKCVYFSKTLLSHSWGPKKQFGKIFLGMQGRPN